MQITIEFPDDIANQLQSINISRRFLELIAADHYRQGQIGAAEVRRMLNFSSRWETYEFLKREKAYLPYTEDDLEQDVQTIRSVLGAEWSLSPILPPSITWSWLVRSTCYPLCSSKLPFLRQSTDAAAPAPVQDWMATPPDWLTVQPVRQPADAIVNLLDPGEREAILLAQQLNADLILLDDMKARRIATERGLAITGILGILDQAATLKLIDLPTAVQSLQNTSFWASDSLFQKLLDKHS